MNITELADKWSAKNEGVRAPNSLDIDGVGTIYVRPIMSDEKEYVDDLRKSAEEPGKKGDEARGNEARAIVNLLCHETGVRLDEQERAIMFPIMLRNTRADNNSIWQAAGKLPNKVEDDQGN